MKEKIKNVFLLISIYAVLYVLSVVLLVVFFNVGVCNRISVFMYRGIILILLTGIVVAVIMYLIKIFTKFSEITVKDIILLFCGCCCVNMVLFTLIPATVERSVSVFMLSYMEENSNQSFNEEEIVEVFEKKYVDEYGAFEKRFEEQVVSGNIAEVEDGKYCITERGKAIVEMFRTVAKWFDTDQRLVYPNEN